PGSLIPELTDHWRITMSQFLIPRPAPPEACAAYARRLREAFSTGPVLVPYETWSREIDQLCTERGITLARPSDFTPERLRRILPAEGQRIPVELLLAYQEIFYAKAYKDPAFTIDRSRLSLPRDRLDDIKAAIERGEANYPLVSCLPRTLTENEEKQTIHRVLMDRLIRAKDIRVWQRSDPNVDTFLEQIRDLTLADLTRTNLTDGDGNPVAFTTEGWLPYLQTLYQTLLRPAATPGYTDLSFVAWERDPPANRDIPGLTDADLAGLNISEAHSRTIQGKSQITAVRLKYPLITPSRHLAFFVQYHTATGEHLDTSTWSWTFGMVDPAGASGEPSLCVYWSAGALNLDRDPPGDVNSGGRLRFSR
ncbi:MAG: hypothetical protein V1723_04010, partial [Candidatus Uhrbacteria bacterium]